jgi:hypothetical protein
VIRTRFPVDTDEFKGISNFYQMAVDSGDAGACALARRLLDQYTKPWVEGSKKAQRPRPKLPFIFRLSRED